MKKIIQEIIRCSLYGKSIGYNEGALNFVLLQINNSPVHIKFGLMLLCLGFLVLSIVYGFGKPFYKYGSKYKKMQFIEAFENLSKPTRMFVSFVRSMAFIYICDNKLV